MKRIALISLASGGLFFLLFSTIHWLTGWPASWFATALGGSIVLGLFAGLLFARRYGDAEGNQSTTRGLFVLIALLMGVVGLLGWLRPTAYQASWSTWLTLGLALYYLGAAATPAIWARRS